VSHSYQAYFCFPGSDLNFDCGLRDNVITRFASVGDFGVKCTTVIILNPTVGLG
jgi:hypothetical protein